MRLQPVMRHMWPPAATSMRTPVSPMLQDHRAGHRTVSTKSLVDSSSCKGGCVPVSGVRSGVHGACARHLPVLPHALAGAHLVGCVAGLGEAERFGAKDVDVVHAVRGRHPQDGPTPWATAGFPRAILPCGLYVHARLHARVRLEAAGEEPDQVQGGRGCRGGLHGGWSHGRVGGGIIA